MVNIYIKPFVDHCNIEIKTRAYYSILQYLFKKNSLNSKSYYLPLLKTTQQYP